MDGTEEVYECAGCAGEVSVVDAIWLPEKSEHAKPYCCRECSEQAIKQLKKDTP